MVDEDDLEGHGVDAVVVGDGLVQRDPQNPSHNHSEICNLKGVTANFSLCILLNIYD